MSRWRRCGWQFWAAVFSSTVGISPHAEVSGSRPRENPSDTLGESSIWGYPGEPHWLVYFNVP